MKFHFLTRERERGEGAGGTVPRSSKTSVGLIGSREGENIVLFYVIVLAKACRISSTVIL